MSERMHKDSAPTWAQLYKRGPWHRVESAGLARYRLLCSDRVVGPHGLYATAHEPGEVVCAAGRWRGFCSRAARALRSVA